MTENEIIAGTTVAFRPDFSAELAGIQWEIVPMPSGRTVQACKADARNGLPAYTTCQIRRRVGKSQRWGYRFAKVSDLIPTEE